MCGELPLSPVTHLERKIAEGMNQSIKALQSWQLDEKLGVIDRGRYKFFQGFRTIVDTARQDLVRKILSFEPYLDAQIILQHTPEFVEALQALTEGTRRNLRGSLVGGYHAQGVILWGIMRGLKYQCGITLPYERMSEAVAH